MHISGSNLTEIVEGLQDSQIRYIQCYNPDLFTKPEDGQPVVTEIQRQALSDFFAGAE